MDLFFFEIYWLFKTDTSLCTFKLELLLVFIIFFLISLFRFFYLLYCRWWLANKPDFLLFGQVSKATGFLHLSLGHLYLFEKSLPLTLKLRQRHGKVPTYTHLFIRIRLDLKLINPHVHLIIMRGVLIEIANFIHILRSIRFYIRYSTSR